MLLEGVRCIGMELEYDSEQSDWQGFDWTPPDPDPLFPSNIFKYTQLPLHATIRISTRTAWRVLMVKTVFSCLSISRNVRKIYDMGQIKMFFWVLSTTWRPLLLFTPVYSSYLCVCSSGWTTTRGRHCSLHQCSLTLPHYVCSEPLSFSSYFCRKYN